MGCTLLEHLICIKQFNNRKNKQGFVFPYKKVWKASVYNRQNVHSGW